ADGDVEQRVRRAPVHADTTARALRVVDHEHGRRIAGLILDRCGVRIRNDLAREHVDAIPRADVFTGAAQDAEVGLQADVPFGLHSLLEPVRVDDLQVVLVVELRLVRLRRHYL